MIPDILFMEYHSRRLSPGPLIGCMDAVGCVRSDAIENPALRDAMRICGRHERGASTHILITLTLIHIREGRGLMGRSS